VQFFYKNSTNLGAVDWGTGVDLVAPAVLAVADLGGSGSARQWCLPTEQTLRARPLMFSSLVSLPLGLNSDSRYPALLRHRAGNYSTPSGQKSNIGGCSLLQRGRSYAHRGCERRRTPQGGRTR
jgi:hypothetical protein